MFALAAQSTSRAWTRITPEGEGAGTALAYGVNTLVLLGGSTVASSNDAASWTSVTLGATGRGLAYGGGLRAVTLRGDAGVARLVAASPDGRAWTRRMTGTGSLDAVAHNGERFVAVGNARPAGQLPISADGITWRRAADGSGAGAWRGIAGNGALCNFVAWGGFSPDLWISRDGETWTRTELRGTATSHLARFESAPRRERGERRLRRDVGDRRRVRGSDLPVEPDQS